MYGQSLLKSFIIIFKSIQETRTLTRHKRSVIFYREGGAPENWGDQVFFLRSKGDQKIFSNKKGGSLIFFKEVNILLNISEHKWNSC